MKLRDMRRFAKTRRGRPFVVWVACAVALLWLVVGSAALEAIRHPIPRAVGVTAGGAIVAFVYFGAHRPAKRYQQRSESGCCLACGYDLRATPGRCPECGTPARRRL